MKRNYSPIDVRHTLESAGWIAVAEILSGLESRAVAEIREKGADVADSVLNSLKSFEDVKSHIRQLAIDNGVTEDPFDA